MTGLYQYNLKDVFRTSHNGIYNVKSDNCYFILQAVIFGYLFKISLRYHKSSNAIDLKNL